MILIWPFALLTWRAAEHTNRLLGRADRKMFDWSIKPFYHWYRYLIIIVALLLSIFPSLDKTNESRWKKHFGGLKAPPIEINNLPKLWILSCRAEWASSTVWLSRRSIWRMFVSSTKRIVARWPVRFEIRHTECPSCPFLLCASRIVILNTAQPVDAAPLP